jgi:hypothetical protein
MAGVINPSSSAVTGSNGLENTFDVPATSFEQEVNRSVNEKTIYNR